MLLRILLQAPNTVTDTVKTATGLVSPNGSAPAAQDTASPLAMVAAGGWMMIPLVLCLLLAIYFAIERLVVISKAKRVDRNFMHNIRDYLVNGKIDSAREFCRSQNTPVSRVIEKGISRLGKPSREISEAMEGAGRLEITRVEKNLHYLSLIARLAPMLGFVGTIIGVIIIFRDISLSGDIAIKGLTHGLYVKMFSSAVGLGVGLIAFLFYHMLNSAVDAVSRKMEVATLAFLDLINEPGK